MARVTAADLAGMKREGKKIVMITAYDALFASLVDQAGVDVILVGDSVGPVLAGEPSTVPVTVNQMIYHGRNVQRGTAHALVVVDLPFMSYHVSPRQATRQGGRVIKRTGAGAVKLEGGRAFAPAVQALVTAGVPVMGHIGLTPQSLNVQGIRLQGKGDDAIERLVDDARALEEAGAFALVAAADVSDRIKTGAHACLNHPAHDQLGRRAMLGCEEDARQVIRRLRNLRQPVDPADDFLAKRRDLSSSS